MYKLVPLFSLSLSFSPFYMDAYILDSIIALPSSINSACLAMQWKAVKTHKSLQYVYIYMHMYSSIRITCVYVCMHTYTKYLH